MLVRILGLLFISLFARGAVAQPAQMRSSPPLPSYGHDASLHGVFFLDADLGWACGDRGTILVTIDGGAKWDMVSTGHEGTLKHIHFFDAEHGIAIGGRSNSLPQQSKILLLESLDGGRSWKRLESSLPAIHAAGFLDNMNAWAVGDCSQQYPSGFFRSSDGGATWTAAAGATPGPWLCGAFMSAQEGILAGYEGIAARMIAKGFAPLDLSLAKPVAIRAAAAIPHGQAILAGDRGALFRIRRGKAPQQLTPALAGPTPPLDFQAAAARGQKIWLAGAPGAVVLHSGDGGETWAHASTGQSTPIRGMYFLDEDRGFAVGDLGLVLATRDGGQTWRPQRRPGQQAAYLGVFSHSKQIPWELLARLSGQEGHYGYVVCVTSHATKVGASATHDSNAVHRAAARLGGIGGVVLPDYPLGERGEYARLALLEEKWKSGNTSARERLEADLVRQIQMWRPEVIFTELPPASDGDPEGQLTCQALLSAAATAARTSASSDPHLSPWQVKRLYAVQPGRRGFKTVESGQIATRLGRSLQEAAWPARRECEALSTLAPEIFGLQLLLDHTDNDATRSDLFSGIRIEAGGPRRRTLSEPNAASVENTARRAKQHHDVIKLLREASEILRPEEIRAQRIIAALEGLDGEFAASALYEMGAIATARGNRTEAIAAWRQLGRDLPDHPLAGKASEQVFAKSSGAELLWKDKETPSPAFSAEGANKRPRETLSQPDSQPHAKREIQPASAIATGALGQDILELLTAHSSAGFETRFSAAALQRTSTDPTVAIDFYRNFANEHAESGFAKCAEMELWLLTRRGAAPKATHSWRVINERPFLDGKLNEPIWNDSALLLSSDRRQRTGSQCWITRDKDYLYFAARCPTSSTLRAKETAAPARRDAHDDRDDRVELLIDVDRDWATFFRFAICEDGSTLDECGGDRSWNPKWFAAVVLEEGQWCAECAIPLSAIVPYAPEAGDAWAIGIQRRGAQRMLESWTHPATCGGHAPGFGVLLTE